MADKKTVTIEDAQIVFRNFAGAEDKFNAAGARNFSVILPEDVAEQMLADGWNVKLLKARDEGDTPTPYVQVAVKYGVRPPRITLLTSTTRTGLGEDTVEMLDYAEFQTVDLIMTGYDWEVNGKSGTKAYLQTMFATIVEDELDFKYAVAEEVHGNLGDIDE